MYDKVINDENKTVIIKLDSSKSTIYPYMSYQQRYSNNIINMPYKTLIKLYIFLSLILFFQIILLFIFYQNRFFVLIDILLFEFIVFVLYCIQVGFHFSINKIKKQFTFSTINLIPFSYFFTQTNYSFDDINSFIFTIGFDYCKLDINKRDDNKIIECFHINEIFKSQNEDNSNELKEFYFELLLTSYYFNNIVNEENDEVAVVNKNFYEILKKNFAITNENNSEDNKIDEI